MSDLKKQIEELRALESEATPGPWEADTKDPADCVVWGPGEQFLGNVDGARAKPAMLAFDVDAANTKLITALRNHALPLIDSLEAENRELQAFAAQCVELGEKQATEFDRVWQALGCLGEEYSVDDAIAKITAMEAENRRLKEIIESIMTILEHDEKYCAGDCGVPESCTFARAKLSTEGGSRE